MSPGEAERYAVAVRVAVRELQRRARELAGFFNRTDAEQLLGTVGELEALARRLDREARP